ncbi:hypothetical protein MWN33_02205 [Starkeya koreensis]|uniref:Uncharacterized protein n=1 Tax=Ancylobacter koreensis TaxID=266121 RepID=A0ABT0DI30_9HYPH|nr:hypothetical protein [Ancylobacter koreensis]MCK0206839.1 hypothetical protein [Ancylobacter koreensis]
MNALMNGPARCLARALLRLPAALAAALIAAALASPAAADALADYVAARDSAIAESLAAAKAGTGGEEAVIKREDAALEDLSRRLSAALGPLKVKGLGAPGYSLYGFTYDENTPTRQLDGLAFANKDLTIRLVVTPEPVFQSWLAARGKDEGAPAALAGGIEAAMTTNEFYGSALLVEGGFFQPYMTLPVTAVPGETAFAVLGVLADEPPGNTPPDQIVIVRLAGGKAMVGGTLVKLPIKPIAACDALWKPFKQKADALAAEIEKAGNIEDPRWESLYAGLDAGGAAYRACFAREAPNQPFFAAALKRAEAFLQTARGN